jgi:hypothetical protein
MEIAMAHYYFKTRGIAGKISKDTIVQLACVGIMLPFVAMWVLLATFGGPTRPMGRAEIEHRMDEFARKYVDTHDREIPHELYKLARELEKLDKEYLD